MFSHLQANFRQYMLKALRPGRNIQELLSLIGRAEGIHSDHQRHMLESVIELHDTRVREVMLPRSDIQAIDVSMPIQAVADMMVECSCARLPVMDADLDAILGIVHIHDVLQAITTQSNASLKTLMRPHLTVSELELVSGLLSEMRANGSHIAIVIDEFGGTAGLVTLSNILSEIVGNLHEHQGHEDSEFTKVEDGIWEVQARMHVEELEDFLSVRLPKGDFDTVGGLIITELGRIPSQGEHVKVAMLDIHIQKADPRRVLQVLIKYQPTSTS